jgi:hypothetical protein
VLSSHIWLTSSSSIPWWDKAWAAALATAIGDLLVLVGIVVAWRIYRRQKREENKRRQESTLAHLWGVRAALKDWYDGFFTTKYQGADLLGRSQMDYDVVMETGSYSQNFRVSTAAIANLIQPSGDLWPLREETVRAATIALQRMTVFNQLVQQQTDFNLQNAVAMRYGSIAKREPIAASARRISFDVHNAIDDASWYGALGRALVLDIFDLERRLRASKASKYVAMPRGNSLLMSNWIRPPWRL